MNKLLVAKLSKGNSKMGRVWNISLPPVTACPKGVPCADKCYARKAYRQYPATRAAWDHNLEFARSDCPGFHESIREQLRAARKLPTFFRWHVSGDILSEDYLDEMMETAAEFPGVKFLAFTKQHHLVAFVAEMARDNGPSFVTVANSMPQNLTIVFSAWPNHPIHNPHGFPVAWCQDGTEDRVPETALSCPGNCEACGMCWELPKLGRDVTFDIH
jgi:hypothetical protein